MSYNNLPEVLLERLQPKYIEIYASATGWERVREKTGSYSVYRIPFPQMNEIVVPLDSTYADYRRRLLDVVETISQTEQRPVLDVLIDLLMPSDVFKFRVESPGMSAGEIPLHDGIELHKGIKDVLMAAAMDAIKPSKFHEKLQQIDATTFIDGCRLGQSERGSYIASVICPLDLAFGKDFNQSQATLFDYQKEEFSEKVAKGLPRRATSRMMSSLARLHKSLSEDNTSELLNPQNADSMISGNFFQALTEMKPEGKDAKLSVMAHWSPAVKSVENTPPLIVIEEKHFPIIADIGKQLRPVERPKIGDFVGKVSVLSGAESANNLMQGEVVLSCLVDDAVVNARVELSATDYPSACDAHKENKYVHIEGSLVRESARLYRIESYRSFRVLTDEVTFGPKLKPKWAKRVRARLKLQTDLFDE